MKSDRLIGFMWAPNVTNRPQFRGRRSRWTRAGASEMLGLASAVSRTNHPFYDPNDGTPQGRLLDPSECPDQRVSIGVRENVGDIIGNWRFRSFLTFPGDMRRSFKEEMHRDVENLRHRLQAAGADAISAFFVFLYLLESEAELFRQ